MRTRRSFLKDIAAGAEGAVRPVIEPDGKIQNHRVDPILDLLMNGLRKNME